MTIFNHIQLRPNTFVEFTRDRGSIFFYKYVITRHLQNYASSNMDELRNCNLYMVLNSTLTSDNENLNDTHYLKQINK